jgi:hypothetical protein
MGLVTISTSLAAASVPHFGESAPKPCSLPVKGRQHHVMRKKHRRLIAPLLLLCSLYAVIELKESSIMGSLSSLITASWRSLTKIKGLSSPEKDHSPSKQPKVSHHSWGPEGIDIQKVIEYINTTYHNPRRFPPRKWRFEVFQPFPCYLIKTNSKPTLWFPERVMSVIRMGAERMKLKSTIHYWQHAVKDLLLENENQFPPLVSALQLNISIPMVFDLFDYRNCPDPLSHIDDVRVPEPLKSLPVFTYARSVKCSYYFPIPTYSTYAYAKMGESKTDAPAWQDLMEEWSRLYPWDNKIAKAYFRGTLRNPRKPLAKLLENCQNLTSSLDVIIFTHSMKNKTHDPPEKSMSYKIALDIDGNSWSERFGRLLCYNSAVVKISVENDFEEYFMTELVPGVHFIPADLENFTSVVATVLQNDDYLQQVIHNANEWCRERLHIDRLNLDFLGVLNGYVEELNRRGDWMKTWKQVEPEFLGPGLGGFIDEIGDKVDKIALTI